MDKKLVFEESEEEKRFLSSVMPAMVEKITARVSDKTKKSLEGLAKKYNMSMSEIVRQLTEQGLKNVRREK